ncbi:MAG: FkbM family methyltransferase [Sumerlaeia bacterium]
MNPAPKAEPRIDQLPVIDVTSEFPKPKKEKPKSFWGRVSKSVRYHLFGPAPADSNPFTPYMARLNLLDRTADFPVIFPKHRWCFVRFSDEGDFLTAMMKDIRPADVVWDVGSFLGMVTVFAGKFASEGRVIAIEPDPALAARTRKNLVLNGVKNAEVIEVGLGEEEGTVRLNTSGESGAAPAIMDKGLETYIEIAIKTVDQLVAEEPARFPNILKIDVEGFETHVLRGMKATLEDERLRSIYLELHPVYLFKKGEAIEEPLVLLREAGFEMTYCLVKRQEMVFAFQRKSKKAAASGS